MSYNYYQEDDFNQKRVRELYAEVLKRGYRVTSNWQQKLTRTNGMSHATRIEGRHSSIKLYEVYYD